MLYWLTGKVYSSARIYYETSQRPSEEWPACPIKVPTALSSYPKDPWTPVRSLYDPGSSFANVVSYTEPIKGGHFPAMEQPEFWAKDVAGFFSKL